MKSIFVIIIAMTCFFSCAVEAAQSKNQISKQRENIIRQVSTQNEIQILSNNCWAIRSRIVSAYGTPRQSSGCQNLIKQEITNYLNAVGTPTARQLLSEFQANGFQNFM